MPIPCLSRMRYWERWAGHYFQLFRRITKGLFSNLSAAMTGGRQLSLHTAQRTRTATVASIWQVFQVRMERILARYIWQFVCVYIDDVYNMLKG